MEMAKQDSDAAAVENTGVHLYKGHLIVDIGKTDTKTNIGLTENDLFRVASMWMNNVYDVHREELIGKYNGSVGISTKLDGRVELVRNYDHET